MGRLAVGGRDGFSPVLYDLKVDGTMISHARYDFPVVGSGWLSVSGTYASQDEQDMCRVDFDKAWIKVVNSNEDDVDDQPFASLDDVPSSLAKSVIQALGQLFFIDAVSIFPVSYLDQDLIVFDFKLLGTRIVARKIQPR